jgi:hypothetical protein
MAAFRDDASSGKPRTTAEGMGAKERDAVEASSALADERRHPLSSMMTSKIYRAVKPLRCEGGPPASGSLPLTTVGLTALVLRLD